MIRAYADGRRWICPSVTTDGFIRHKYRQTFPSVNTDEYFHHKISTDIFVTKYRRNHLKARNPTETKIQIPEEEKKNRNISTYQMSTKIQLFKMPETHNSVPQLSLESRQTQIVLHLPL